jgi:ADP-heptose:LPS heptosyltransferase
MPAPRRLLISRTDSIGDVMLTLPLATMLKQHFPELHVGFLGRSYTQPVVACCAAVDAFVELNDFLAIRNSGQYWDTIVHVFPRKDIAWHALKSGIATRVGTSSRPYHWLTCNKLVKLSRRHSPLHEAQLNMQLLRPFGITSIASKEALGQLYAFKAAPLPAELGALLAPGKRHIILHPKSQGSAREWGLQNFAALAKLLRAEDYQVFISGTAAERKLMNPLFEEAGNEVIDITGRMNLSAFISFIDACDALVAASTGPLHIAAALGKVAVGLYPSIRPMDAGRWGPIGPNAVAMSLPEDCNRCRNEPERCVCLQQIFPTEVANTLKRKLYQPADP